MTQRERFFEIFARSASEAIVNNEAPWMKTIAAEDSHLYLPVNAATSKPFRGVNALYLTLQGKGDPRWMTYEQAKKMGGQVAYGEKGTAIQFWQFTEQRLKFDADGMPIINAQGHPEFETVDLKNPIGHTKHVFNASQVMGIPSYSVPKLESDRTKEVVDSLFVAHGHHAKLPSNEVKNTLSGVFQSVSEEFTFVEQALRVELASYMLGISTGIGHTPNPALEAKDWLDLTYQNPRAFLQMAAEAQKMVDHVLRIQVEYNLIVNDIQKVNSEVNSDVTLHEHHREHDTRDQSDAIRTDETVRGTGGDSVGLPRTAVASRSIGSGQSTPGSDRSDGFDRGDASDATSSGSNKSDHAERDPGRSEADIRSGGISSPVEQVSLSLDATAPSSTLEELRNKLEQFDDKMLEKTLRGSRLQVQGTRNERIDRLVLAREAADIFKQYDSLDSFEEAIKAGSLDKKKVYAWHLAVKKPQQSEESDINWSLNAISVWRWGNDSGAFDIPIRNAEQEADYQQRAAEGRVLAEQEEAARVAADKQLYRSIAENRDAIEQTWSNLDYDLKEAFAKSNHLTTRFLKRADFNDLPDSHKMQFAMWVLSEASKSILAEQQERLTLKEKSEISSIETTLSEPPIPEEKNKPEILAAKNFRITESDQLGDGGAIAKTRANIEAIRIVKALDAENRPATIEEQQKLVKYVGWGASDIANNLFPTKREPEGTWKTLREQLDTLLTAEELATAQRSTQYAHYTSPAIIDGIYQAIDRLGFKSGLVFEGGMGVGHFNGLMPDQFNTEYYGVEMDGISAQIAKALYPESNIIHGDFTKVGLPQDHFDLVLGNPPFSATTVRSDPAYKDQSFMLHDYFIAKQIDALRPGGVAAFVTSKSTMDKGNDEARQYIADRADFMGGIRLPQTAFKQNAGTEVVTDILFFQKRDPGQLAQGQDWANLKEITTPDGPVMINEYFADHPEMILGESRLTGTMYRDNEYTVVPTGDIGTMLADAVQKLPVGIVADNPSKKAMQTKIALYDIGETRPEDSYYIGAKGDLRQVKDGFGQAVLVRGGEQRSGFSKKQEQIVRDYIPLRDAVMEVYREQFANGDWQGAQQRLHVAYDAFVKKHGPLNQSKTITRKDGVEITQEPIVNTIEEDPDAYRVTGIESYDEVEQTATKNPIFYDQLINKKPIQNIESAMDALAVTLNDCGHLDFDYLLEKYPGTSKEEVVSELGEAIFFDPGLEKWTTADDYLSGNVKFKLKMAEESARENSALHRNVSALQKVQPEDMEISRIPINLGAHWIPESIIQQFAEQKLDFTGKITSFIHDENSFWSVDGNSANQTFATSRMKCSEVLNHALNKITPVIRDTFVDSEGKKSSRINREETTAATQKVQDLKEEFYHFAVGNLDVSQQLHELYNRNFNTTVPRQYDGKHLSLPRLSIKYSLHDWQRNAVWRILQNGNTYMAHEVGAGKTLASSVAAMELKRLGLAKKPCFVVLKSTLKQFATEYLDAYPDANILVADEKQLDKQNRRRFLGKMANNDFDAVIMTHESFETIPLPAHFMQRYINKELEQYRDVLMNMDESERGPRKRIEKQIEALEERLQGVVNAEGKDKGITFDETGIDFLFVDEAHHHKKIPFATNQQNTKGVTSDGSNIAFDMFLKTRYLNEVKPGHHTVLMSGTPVTNTLGEVYNIQRYLQPDVLGRNKISSFDAWSATFADTVTELEMQPSGNFKPSTRLAKFVGVPGLLRDFLQVADIVTSEHLNKSLTIKRPNLVDGQRKIITVPASPLLRSYQEELGKRIEAIEARKRPPRKGDDIILSVITDGRKSAYDLRMVGLPQDTPSKVDVLIDQVYQIWKNTSDNVYHTKGKAEAKPGATQLIFTELKESNGFNIYDHIRDELVKRGVPKDEVAFIQDANNSQKKRRLFKEMNSGVRRIMLGGSQNMGTGVNVQQRLIAVHHLDIDYLPANIVQREGRILRQGNKNSEVSIYAYATEGTVDAFMWQLNETKQKMIDQVMGGNLSIDTVTDISESANQMAMAKALASGNPLILEQAGLQSEVKKLQALKSAHYNQRLNNKSKLDYVVEQNNHLNAALSTMTELAEQYKETTGDLFTATIKDHVYKERKETGSAIIREAYKLKGNRQYHEPVSIGQMSGYEVFMRSLPIGDGLQITLGSNDQKLSRYLNVVEFNFTDINEVGLVRRVENAAKAIPAMPEQMQNDLQANEKLITNLRSSLNAEFQYDADLNSKRERLEQVNQMIAGNRSTLANSDDTVTVEQTANIIAVEDNTDTPRQDESMSYQILSDLANEAMESALSIEETKKEYEIRSEPVSEHIPEPITYHAKVSSLLAELAEQGNAPWQKVISPEESFQALPINPITNQRYSGINALYLMAQNRNDPRWLTEEQAVKMGGALKQGERGTVIAYWKMDDSETATELVRPQLLLTTVYNAEQFENLTLSETVLPEKHNRVPDLLASSGVTIEHGENDKCYYHPANNKITVPPPANCRSESAYHSLVLTQLGHWSGRDDQMKRGTHPFGSHEHTKEQLRAGIASMFLGLEMGIGYEPSKINNSAVIDLLRNDENEIFRLALEGEKICAHLSKISSEQALVEANTLANQNTSGLSSFVVPAKVQEQYIAIGQKYFFLESPRDVAFLDTGKRLETPFVDQKVVSSLLDIAEERGWSKIDVTGTEKFRRLVWLEASLRGVHVNGYMPEDEDLSMLEAAKRALSEPSVDAGAHPDGVDRMAGELVSFGKAPYEHDKKNKPSYFVEIKDDVGAVQTIWGVDLERALQESGAEISDRVTLANLGRQPVEVERNIVDDQGKVIGSEKIEAYRNEWQVSVLEMGSRTASETLAESENETQELKDGQPPMKTTSKNQKDNLYISIPFADRDAAKELGAKWDKEAKSWYIPSGVDVAAFDKWIGKPSNTIDRMAGELVSFGKAPYEHDKKNKPSYFVEIKNDDGAVQTVWGVDLERALQESGAEISDTVSLVNLGRQPVEAKRNIIDDQGRVIGSEKIEAYRNEWQVSVLEMGSRTSSEALADSEHETQEGNVQTAPTYLAVPYGEREAAKAYGAKWDSGAKLWFAPEGGDMVRLARWLPDNQQKLTSVTDPRKEFAETLMSLGCLLSGDHPVMDGKTHRIKIEGDKNGEKSGFYIGHLDGHPAGYVKNNRTGLEVKWKAKGYSLSEEHKVRLHTEAAQKRQERENELISLHEACADRLTSQLSKLQPLSHSTPYMEAKRISVKPGVFTDDGGKTMFVPAYDATGKQWTTQYINEEGQKRFAKDSRKEGCFHVVGGHDALKNTSVLLISEGYATASTISEALNMPVVAAFDSGNLKKVAVALKEHYPDVPIVICGDDDRSVEENQGVNPGRQKADEAAKAVNGVTVFPIFAPGEQDNNPKGFSDFNDLASKSQLGLDAVRDQLEIVLNKLRDEKLSEHNKMETSRSEVKHREIKSKAVRI